MLDFTRTVISVSGKLNVFSKILLDKRARKYGLDHYLKHHAPKKHPPIKRSKR
jgi:hypothetical protein